MRKVALGAVAWAILELISRCRSTFHRHIACYTNPKMRRALHIAVSLMLAVLLFRPFECFAAAAPRSQVADCCWKGECAPTANSDACCKSSVPDRNQFLPSKAAPHSSPLIAIVEVYVSTLAPRLTLRAFADPSRHPPPRIELAAPSLPLLV